MNRRKEPRHKYALVTVDISDGYRIFSGTILDISKNGMCLAGIPNGIDTSVDKYTVVVSLGPKTFILTARPKWIKEQIISEQILSLKIGFLLDNPPSEWTEFIMELEDCPVNTYGHTE